MTKTTVPHPAKFSTEIIPILAEILHDSPSVLDPFAGVGKLATVKEHGYTGIVVCNEIEAEWATASPYPVDEWHIGDAAAMAWASDGQFAAICTSPTYGNRMADHFNARDSSRRITYRHMLGRELNEQNTGRMQFGERYQQKHIEVYTECWRVLRVAGLMVLNISDHVRAGKIVPVTDWHKTSLARIGFTPINEIAVRTPRMRFGQNRNARVDHESILVYKKL